MKFRLTVLFLFAAAFAPAQEHWVATWATAQLMARLPAPPAAANAKQPPATPPPGSRFPPRRVTMRRCTAGRPTQRLERVSGKTSVIEKNPRAELDSGPLTCSHGLTWEKGTSP